MADLVITSSDVDRVSGSQRTTEAAVAVSAGAPVFLDANGLANPCQHDVDAASAAAVGIALHDAGAGQPLTYQVSGVVDLGSVLTVGDVYVVGAGAGAIAPVADVGIGDFMTVLGVAVTATNLKIGINQAGVASA